MSMTKTLVAAATTIALSSTAFAGGVDPIEPIAPVIIVEPTEVATGGSVPGWVIPAVIVAALVAVAVSNDD